MNAHELLYPEGCILSMNRGSISHGTYDYAGGIDDVDIMTVTLREPSYYLGLRHSNKGTRDRMVEIDGLLHDSVEYEYRKFISLLLKSNPNVLGMLWLPPESRFHTTNAGQALIDNRHLFGSSILAFKSFCGYAGGQLKRMRSPSYGRMGAKRRELFDRLGYDSKNASHLIRLLRMGIEYLETGEMNVDRRGIDADELLAIKRGEWGIDRIESVADAMFVTARRLVDKSPLPLRPDTEMVAVMVEQTLWQHITRYRTGQGFDPLGVAHD